MAYVMTVDGPISPDDVGIAMPHEHLYMHAVAALGVPISPRDVKSTITIEKAAEVRWAPASYPDNGVFTDTDVVVAELGHYRDAGGRTIVDLTPGSFGRDPEKLREIARSSGVQVVMGGAYFTEPYHPADTASRSERSLADELISEIRDGVGDTGIRPGIMGEIGTGDPFTEAEARTLRAHAWAHLETSVALSLHLEPWGKEGHKVLDILAAEGVPFDRVVLGHMTTSVYDDDYQRSLLDRGAYIQYDLFGFDHSLIGAGRYPPSEWDQAEKLVDLARSGYGDRLMISQDIGEYIRLVAYGGWGYAHILRHIVPLLKGRGMDDATVSRILVDNPRRILTIDEPNEAA
jgi:phosphotriesterase-related protein